MDEEHFSRIRAICTSKFRLKHKNIFDIPHQQPCRYKKKKKIEKEKNYYCVSLSLVGCFLFSTALRVQRFCERTILESQNARFDCFMSDLLIKRNAHAIGNGFISAIWPNFSGRSEFIIWAWREKFRVTLDFQNSNIECVHFFG